VLVDHVVVSVDEIGWVLIHALVNVVLISEQLERVWAEALSGCEPASCQTGKDGNSKCNSEGGNLGSGLCSNVSFGVSHAEISSWVAFGSDDGDADGTNDSGEDTWHSVERVNSASVLEVDLISQEWSDFLETNGRKDSSKIADQNGSPWCGNNVS
jgi:hypothetical protein